MMESTNWLKLDANEGTCILDSSQLARVLSPEVARRYPRASLLEVELSAFLGVDPTQIIATAGADDAIDRAFRALAGPGARILSTVPGFVEFLDASKRTGAEAISCRRTPGEPFPLAGFCSMIETEKPAIAVLATPDNPLGTMLSSDELRTILASCGKIGSTFILDVTYIDFADRNDLIAIGLESDNVIITGSFSKSRGLAGFRAGWAMAGQRSLRIIAALREAGPPYSLSSPAIEASRLSLSEASSRYTAFVDRIRFERENLTAFLIAQGIRTWPQQANFVSVLVPDAAGFGKGLRDQGILVRYWQGNKPAEGLVRITCPGEPVEFERLKKALGTLEGAR